MDWFKEKLWHLNDIFEKYPKVYRRSILNIILAGIIAIGYFLILNGITHSTMFIAQPFQVFINEYHDVLKWGQFIVPMAVLFWGWGDAEELYFKLKNRRYRY